jgi:16S rRNA (cytosine967-C5)-methyltransferase
MGGQFVSATSARRLAREVVTQVRERTAYSHEVLDSRLRAVQLPPAEASFATRLAYGVIQTQGTLDEALDRHLSGRRIEPRLRDALAVSAYELLFLGTEPRIAVHQGVELVRGLRSQAAGLANAVLRRLADDAPAFPWGDPETDDAALARLHGHPLWLAQMWIAELGRDVAVEVMTADNEPAPLYVAINPFAASPEEARAVMEADGADPRPCAVTGCIEAGDAGAAVRGAALRDGLVLACDATAQAIVRLAHVTAGRRLLEVGSGRGTKTILLQATALESGGPADIYAVDLHPFKAHLLAERLGRFGVPNVTPLTGDATHMTAIEGVPEAGSLDAVLVDAPCSGLGTLRRHPEKRWRVTPQDLESLSALSLRLLEAAAALVRPGGFVVYSTCTVARQENAAVVDSFLADERGGTWSVDDVAGEVPVEWRRFITGEGYFSSHPVSGGPDGHFAARLRRS